MSEASNLVTLKAGGQTFEGWTDVTVSTGLRDISGSFSLGFVTPNEGVANPPRIKWGEACQVLIGDEVVITGWIDATNPRYDAQDRGMTVEGRHKAADLVDCSAMNRPGVWRNRTFAQIATDLVSPFGLEIELRAPAGAPFARFAIQQGETVFDALDRLARFRGLLAISTPEGGVAFINPVNAPRAAFRLVQGDNILAADATHDARDRFSHYVVKGQSAGDDNTNGAAASGPAGEARDPGVTRYRPQLIMAEEQPTLKSLRDRAAWAANVRAAEGETVDITVQGWRDPSGALWQRGVIVPVSSSWVDVEGDRLIVDVTYQLSNEQGSTAVLSCAPLNAYQPEPPEAEA